MSDHTLSMLLIFAGPLVGFAMGRWAAAPRRPRYRPPDRLVQGGYQAPPGPRPPVPSGRYPQPRRPSTPVPTTGSAAKPPPPRVA